MAQVALASRTETVTRTVFLGRFVEELTRRLSGYMGSWYADIISKGVVQRQYISRLFISYLKEEKLVGRVELLVDYERHRVNIARHGEHFSFDLATPVASQASPGLERFIKIFAKLLSLPGVSVELSWYWSSGIDLEEAKKWMGSAEGQIHQWHTGGPSSVGSGSRPRASLEDLDRFLDSARQPATAEIDHRPGALDEVQLVGQIVLDALTEGRKGENSEH